MTRNRESGIAAVTTSSVTAACRLRVVLVSFQTNDMWKVAGHEVEPGARVKLQQVFQAKLDELDACGVYVFGGRSSESLPDGANRQEGALVFKRADDPQIVQPKLLRQFGKAMCFITLPVDRESN